MRRNHTLEGQKSADVSFPEVVDDDGKLSLQSLSPYHHFSCDCDMSMAISDSSTEGPEVKRTRDHLEV